ncbi:MAG: hypothetical protein AB1846_11805 [Chloroflexota bacterium]
MQPESQSPFTFIVRLWREKNGSQVVWRGSVDHIQSGERAYFQAASHFMEIVSGILQEIIPGNVETGEDPRSDEPGGL